MNFETKVQRIVNRMLQPYRQLRGMIRRATIGPAGTGPLPVTLGQVFQMLTTSGDVDDDVEVFEQYGITSIPLPGSEAIILRVGGERAGSVAICVGLKSTRFSDLAAGEVAIYNATGQSQIVLRNTGDIEVMPVASLTGKVRLGGDTATATLEVARRTDPIEPGSILSGGIGAWAQTVETAINVLAAGTFTPANSFATTVAANASTGAFGTILSGGQGATCV